MREILQIAEEVYEEGVSIGGIVIIALIFSFALAWAIGANDVANTFGTSVGAKVLTLTQALLLASIFEFLGAFLLGSHVANTFKRSMVDITFYDENPVELMVGMTSSLIGAFLLLFGATYFSLPVSATHSIVGAVLGFGLASVGVAGIKWREISLIALSWVVSPVAAGMISATIFSITRSLVLRSEHSFVRGIYLIPFYYFITITFNVFFIIYKGAGEGYLNLQIITIKMGLLIAFIAGLIVFIIVFCFLGKFRTFVLNRYYEKFNQNLFEIANESVANQEAEIEQENSKEGSIDLDQSLLPNDEEKALTSSQMFTSYHTFSRCEFEGRNGVELFDGRTEELYSILQVLTACFESFAHGSNDVANAIGPLAIILGIYSTGVINPIASIDWWILAAGGLGVVIGLATWGYRVMYTIGKHITTVTPARGFHIEFAAALTVVIGSRLSLPLSTTHCKVGAVVGVGLTEGQYNVINWTLLLKIIMGWISTLPVAAAISALIYYNLYFLIQWERV